MAKKWLMMLGMTLAALVPAFGQTVEVPAPATDLSAGPIVSTLIYGVIGIFLYVLGYFVFDRVMKLDLRKELVEDQNEALGIMMAGVFIGIAIIIMSAIG